MKDKKLCLSGILILILLTFSLQGLSASLNSPALSVSGGWHGSFPSEIHEETLHVRTHGYGSVDLIPLSYRLTGNLSLELRSGFSYTTDSLPYEGVYWKQFFTLSAGGGLLYNLTYVDSLSAGVVSALQLPDDDRGVFTFLSPYLSYNRTLYRTELYDIDLIIPVSVELRSDYTAVKGGAGILFRWKGDME